MCYMANHQTSKLNEWLTTLQTRPHNIRSRPAHQAGRRACQRREISAGMVEEFIKNDSGTDGVHPDNLPFYMVKHCRSELARIWTHLFNLVFNMEQIPKAWKREIVCPIPKIPDPPDLSKISLLPYRNKL